LIPNESEALEFHKRAASSDQVVRHCKLVAKVSEIIAKGLLEKGQRVNERVIYSAALLHDIGRSETNSILHGVAGARIVERFGCDESVAEIIRRHVGAGISSEEAEKYGFPKGDYVPRTLEQKVVCFADKLVASETIVSFEREAEKFRRKALDVERLYALKESIRLALGQDPEELIAKKIGNIDGSLE
jgi:uncharacterized protein (TIGR00295 family)